jgi:phage terminase small subunit
MPSTAKRARVIGPENLTKIEIAATIERQYLGG